MIIFNYQAALWGVTTSQLLYPSFAHEEIGVLSPLEEWYCSLWLLISNWASESYLILLVNSWTTNIIYTLKLLVDTFSFCGLFVWELNLGPCVNKADLPLSHITNHFSFFCFATGLAKGSQTSVELTLQPSQVWTWRLPCLSLLRPNPSNPFWITLSISLVML